MVVDKGCPSPGVDESTGVQPPDAVVHLLVEIRVLGHIYSDILHIHVLFEHVIGIGLTKGVQKSLGNILIGHGEHFPISIPLEGIQDLPIGEGVHGMKAIRIPGQQWHFEEHSLGIGRANTLETLRQQLLQGKEWCVIQLHADQVKEQGLVAYPQGYAGPQPVGGDEAMPPGAWQAGQGGPQKQAHHLQSPATIVI